MRYLKVPFLLLWRAWFYILLFSTIIIMVPFLLVLTAKESYYLTFWKMIRVWAKIIVYGMGFRLKVDYDQRIESDRSYMFCANHASFIDPFVMIVLSKNPIVFVGKRELVKIPIFGFFYRRVVIMVDRSSEKSRKNVYIRAKKRFKNGVSMGIFPEGLVPYEGDVLAPFKKGAFSLAIEFEIPIVTQIYYEAKQYFSWNFFRGGPGVIRIKQHKFIETKNLTQKDIESLKQKVFDIIYQDLNADEKYMAETNRYKK